MIINITMFMLISKDSGLVFLYFYMMYAVILPFTILQKL